MKFMLFFEFGKGQKTQDSKLQSMIDKRVAVAEKRMKETQKAYTQKCQEASATAKELEKLKGKKGKGKK